MKKKAKARRWIQIAFFVVAALIAVNHTLAESGTAIPFVAEASLHAVCPFGGVVTLYNLATTGTFVQKIHESSLVLMLIVFGAAILVGPIFCGWICPFGTFQEWLGKLGRKIFKKKYNKFIPYKYDKYLRFLRYLVLIWAVVMTAWSGKIIFADFDPYYALFQFWTGEVAVTGFIALFLVVLLSLFVERPFCKYACPYGAVLGLFNFIRIFALRRNADTCISCSACDNACPMNIPVSRKGKIMNHQCISCFECTSTDGVCPVSGTLEFNTSALKGGSDEN
ncbi:4Fe-4S binding protein [Spirochaeta isovalerica]|uniref:Polyferredoxin n=1 Tax=Spirochaeta isovalerica TaxID=150 RepID=A0A841RDD8_9SPIO|nr:4Fe-4S binding protein [Spirochaeta isovalerica]MBB6480869.1 polyferredoxin [Spirochaeta isovalerica]